MVPARIEGLEAVGTGGGSTCPAGPSRWADGVVFTGTGPPIQVPGQPRPIRG